jgi:hypothetical protein
MSVYDPCFAYSVEDAITADYFFYEMERTHPLSKVLSLDEILNSGTITHWCRKKV